MEVFEDAFLDEKDTKMKARINGVRYQMMAFEFYFGINLAKLLLLHTDNLACSLQKKELSASEGKNLYKATLETLKDMKKIEFESS